MHDVAIVFPPYPPLGADFGPPPKWRGSAIHRANSLGVHFETMPKSPTIHCPVLCICEGPFTI